MSIRIQANLPTATNQGVVAQGAKFTPNNQTVSTIASLEVGASGGGCLETVGNSIRSFFSWIFCCFTGPSVDQMVSRLQEIAARAGFIWFYDKTQNALTAFLGNFHPCAVKFRGITFSCAEAAFQAAKFHPNRAQMASFANLTGDQAFRRARELTNDWTPAQLGAWQAKNFNVMLEVLDAKFANNADLKRLLLATGKAHLIEHVPVVGRDGYWADNGDGTGLNMLGEGLMKTRYALGGHGVVPRPASYNPANCR